MLYPVYVYKEDTSAYGIVFPDIPGCFAAADDIQKVPRAAQEAVEAHFGADEDPIPAASAPDAWTGHADYEGGFWMLVDLDLSRARSRAVRLMRLPVNADNRVRPSWLLRPSTKWRAFKPKPGY